MFCPSCKAEIADGLKYCTQCGTALEAHNASSAQTGAAVRQTAQAQGVTPAAGQQAQQPTQAQQRPQQPVAASQQVAQPQFQQQRPQQPIKQEPPKNSAPKKTGPVPFIALGISIVALILAIVGFVLPKSSQPTPAPVTTSSAPKAVAADKTPVTIKAGDTTGKAKILDEGTSYIVVGTSVGGNELFSDVMFDQAKGEIYLTAKNAVDKDTEREVMWVAYEK